MNTEGRYKTGSYAYTKIEENIMEWEEKTTEKQNRVQFMLEYVDLDQSLVSSEMISSTETKVINNIIEVFEPLFNHNKKYYTYVW